ncbi:MAG: hypothetical protein IK149_01620 [Oscillospiraceae bacterium]|nr:hypothetical protein [Oscillospiraceae bacterium]
MAARTAEKAKRRELGFVCYMILEDGNTVPFEELTEEQRQRFRENAAARLSARMSDYYTQHPTEIGN